MPAQAAEPAEPSGRTRHVGLALLLLLGAAAGVQAESISCSAGSISPGASRLLLLHACGQPSLADSYCAPVQHLAQPAARPAKPWVRQAVTVCIPVEEWLYDRGAGNLLAIVKISEGRVMSIQYTQRWGR